MANSSSEQPANAVPGYSGRVKWFNNKSGYGFITVLKTDEAAAVPVGTDVFAHHMEINVSCDQYRYLVQGEYVAFDVVKTTNANHEYQCAKVKGMYGGQLICETRHDARSQYKTSGSGSGSDNLESSRYGDAPDSAPAPAQNNNSNSNSRGSKRFANVKSSTEGGRGGFRR
jgi:cold shock CspA family protein